MQSRSLLKCLKETIIRREKVGMCLVGRGKAFFKVFLLACLLLPSSPSWSLEISQESYNELVEISLRLNENNKRLESALTSSNESIERLQSLYRAQTNELTSLRRDYEKVRSNLESSAELSNELGVHLANTTRSLRNLEQSLDRLENKIKVLKASRVIVAIVSFLGGLVTGAGAWQIFSSLPL